MRFLKYMVLASLLVTSLSLYAKDADIDVTSTDEAKELEQLLELLQEQTTLATKTRLNSDYVPGMITVLHHDELQNRGVRTVWEALGLVPGVVLSIEEAGRKQVVFRGVGRTYASGNAKILLNGNSMNTAYIAHATPVMNIPIEQVERIEVIRGPGSAVHGEFALIGVINVITRKDESRVFIMGGDNNTLGAGVMLTYKDETSPLMMNLNLAGYDTDGADVLAGRDELFYENSGANSSFSHSPGPTNEAAENKTGIFSLNYDKFSLTAQKLDDAYGDHFGRNQFLPPNNKRVVTRNKYETVEIKQLFDMGKGWDSEVYAGWQDREQMKDDLYTAPDFTGGNDYVVDIYYRETRTNAGVDLTWTDNDIHQFLLGVEHVNIDVDRELNEYQQSGVTLSSWFWVNPDTTRRILSTTLQEELRLNDDLTATFGLRHDDYNDIDSEISPRLAAVWRKDQQNIFKAQYARAFRPPTFYEMAAAITTVSGSTIHTVDLGYIHKNIDSEYAVTLFKSKIDQFIVFIDATGFENTESAETYGAEFELKYKIRKNINVDGNISYLESDDNNTGLSLPGSTDWVGNLGINYQPLLRTNLALQYRYVGETYRQSTDTREKLDSYETVDATLTLSELLDQNITFRAGIKNLFNEDVRYPAPVLTYVEDHPRARRQWWLQFTYNF